MSPPSPTRRVILLGASNVVRAFPTLVETVRRTWCEPIDFMVAMGHGRSYGQDSAVFGRKISGIFPCALWRDLHERAPLPTTALVTDIGNDLLYGVTPARLVSWVEQCVNRLANVGATTIVTHLPAASIERLGQRRFALFRTMLFPRSNLTLAAAKQHMREMNQRLDALAEPQKVSVISASGAWYGFDPIHVTRRSFRKAWPTILADWLDEDEQVVFSKSSLLMTAYLASLAPFEYSRFGMKRCAAQPCARFIDGTTISLY